MRFRQNGHDNWHLQLSQPFHDFLFAHLYIFTDSVPSDILAAGEYTEVWHIALQIRILG